MVNAIRNNFNQAFTEDKYQQYLQDLDSAHPGEIAFRVAETAVFCDRAFTQKMLSACEAIVDVIVDPSFPEQSAGAIPDNVFVPGEEGNPNFIAFDFGVCQNEKGELEPQLIEMQGFPSLFAYEGMQAEVFNRHFPVPTHYDSYLNGFNKESYFHMLKEIILGDEKPEHVILLEIFPKEQKTRIDFFVTEAYVGIKMVCLTELQRKGNKLYYQLNGKETEVKRIYNRLIFDDLQQQSDEVQEHGKMLFEGLDVIWVPHPNWFYRISKHTLPFINHPYVPETKFVHDVEQPIADLENYVLKPLFSFAGQGVVIDVTEQDIAGVTDPHNWILQRKVQYADVIATPDGPAKAEIRIFYFWKNGEPRPVAVHNLARLSKGKMIGVRYNKDKTWVGGTIAYFEQ